MAAMTGLGLALVSGVRSAGVKHSAVKLVVPCKTATVQLSIRGFRLECTISLQGTKVVCGLRV